MRPRLAAETEINAPELINIAIIPESSNWKRRKLKFMGTILKAEVYDCKEPLCFPSGWMLELLMVLLLLGRLWRNVRKGQADPGSLNVSNVTSRRSCESYETLAPPIRKPPGTRPITEHLSRLVLQSISWFL